MEREMSHLSATHCVRLYRQNTVKAVLLAAYTERSNWILLGALDELPVTFPKDAVLTANDEDQLV